PAECIEKTNVLQSIACCGAGREAIENTVGLFIPEHDPAPTKRLPCTPPLHDEVAPWSLGEGGHDGLPMTLPAPLEGCAIFPRGIDAQRVQRLCGTPHKAAPRRPHLAEIGQMAGSPVGQEPTAFAACRGRPSDGFG